MRITLQTPCQYCVLDQGRGHTIVENEVNSRELLQSLQRTSSEQSFDNLPSEAIEIARFAHAHFILMISLNFSEFVDHCWVVDWQPPDLREAQSGFLRPVHFDAVSGSFWQDNHPSNQDECPRELNGNRNTIAPCVMPSLCGVVDDCRKKKTNGNGQLVRPDNNSANPLWRCLGLVQWNCNTRILLEVIFGIEISSFHIGEPGA